jgi:hypothetical protein
MPALAGRPVQDAPIPYDYGVWCDMSAEGLDFIQACLEKVGGRLGVQAGWRRGMACAERPLLRETAMHGCV